LQEQVQNYAREREAYQRLISSAEEQRRVDAFDAAWKRYVAIDDTVAALVAKGQREEAIALFRGDLPLTAQAALQP